MPTPPPVLRLEGTEQPPNGQHGPDSGITAHEATPEGDATEPQEGDQ